MPAWFLADWLASACCDDRLASVVARGGGASITAFSADSMPRLEFVRPRLAAICAPRVAATFINGLPLLVIAAVRAAELWLSSKACVSGVTLFASVSALA